MTSKLETLNEATIASLNEIVASVMENEVITKVIDKLNDKGEVVDVDARVDTNAISALIELLTAEKKKAQEADKAYAAADKAAAKAEAEARGAEVKTELNVGDEIEFTMGSGSNKTTFRRKITKITDSTVHVVFDADYPCTTSPNTKPTKYIKFANVIRVVAKAAVVAPAVAKKVAA